MPVSITAAMLILWAPGGFRFTCYYYRGAYYKAFWADPPSCTVGEPRKKYLGERSFPLIMQNIHRYFLYLAIDFHRSSCARRVGRASGLTATSASAWAPSSCLPTWSCSAATPSAATRCVTSSADCRDRLSGSPVRKQAYDCVSCLNRRHMLFAWCSLFLVGFTDCLRAAMCSMGIWTDWRIF